jgi:hypothetical protein
MSFLKKTFLIELLEDMRYPKSLFAKAKICYFTVNKPYINRFY